MKHTTTKLISHILMSASLSLLSITLGEAEPAIAPIGKHIVRQPTPVSPSTHQLHDAKYWSEQRREYKALMNDGWADEQWTGNNAPYAAVRSHIESAVASGVKPQALVNQYAKDTKKKPNDALAQFAWAYATRLAAYSTDIPPRDAINSLHAANIVMAETSSPKTYEYTRLRYLLWIRCEGGAASHFLLGLANRLLEKDPNDFDVRMDLVAIYTQGRDKLSQQKGYLLIQKIIKDEPTRPDAYDALGGWYYTQYMLYHNVRDYQQAMAYYGKALNMYSATSARKAQLPAVMQYLQTRYRQISGG